MVDTFDYLSSRDDADSLIKEFGQSVSVRKTVAAGGDDWAPTQATNDYATFAAIIAYTDYQLKSEDILRSDKRALVAAGPLELSGIISIEPDDKLIVGGAIFQIINAQPINPAGTVVLFDLQLRF